MGASVVFSDTTPYSQKGHGSMYFPWHVALNFGYIYEYPPVYDVFRR